ncbi:hypothetical protein BJ170DRAFT_681274 [Xylariales sp. AK1849]|nr:hypothetical protein BJ170DRAFT_681274 [Xylariales sp. AK1849]
MDNEPSNSGEATINFNLNTAASEFSTSLIRTKVRELAKSCDEDLENNYVSHIRMLLREIDKKRDKFNQSKRSLVEGLRGTLKSLQVNSHTIRDIVSDIDEMTPTWLSTIPAASSLCSNTPTPGSTPPEESPQHSQNSGTTSLAGAGSTVDGAVSSLSLSPAPSVDRRGLQASAASLGKDTISTSQEKQLRQYKRLRDDRKVNEGIQKRPKTIVEGDNPQIVYADIERKIRMADLDPGECVFRIVGREKFYIVRCDSEECSSRISALLPFKYKRAFNHFSSNHFLEGKTEAYIFDHYAYEVEDATLEDMSKRNASGNVPACLPLVSLPKPRNTPKRHDRPTSGGKEKPTEQENATSKRRQTLEMDGDESEDELLPHRNLRRQPKPSYSEMAHGRDPWGVSDEVRLSTRLLLDHGLSEFEIPVLDAYTQFSQSVDGGIHTNGGSKTPVAGRHASRGSVDTPKIAGIPK